MSTTAVKSKQSDYLEKAIELLESKGYDNIKADHPDYELPGKFIRKQTEEEVMPDLTGKTTLGKDYFKIVEGDKHNEQQVVSKWKLFSNLAKMKSGKFFLIVPYGKKKYTTELIKKYNIEADMLKLPNN